jgi:hypothetical protein
LELEQLQYLASEVEKRLGATLPGSGWSVHIGHPESPNPLCFFKIDQRPIFAHGSFWANNEYEILAMDTNLNLLTFEESGSATTPRDALKAVERFTTAVATGITKPPSSPAPPPR